MQFKTLSSILVLGLALAGCGTSPSDEAAAPETTGAMAGEPTPGTPADFKKHIADRVFFGFDKADISHESAHTLQQQADWLKKYPNTHVTVEGYCDARGTAEYNLALGKRRSESAAKQLVKAGVDKSRVKTLSYGKEKVLVPGNTEEAYAQNRTAITVVE